MSELIESITISGKFSDLVKGCPGSKEELAKIMVGMKLEDGNHKVVGKIDSIDVENDLWFGRIDANSETCKSMMDVGSIVSCEFAKGD